MRSSGSLHARTRLRSIGSCHAAATVGLVRQDVRFQRREPIGELHVATKIGEIGHGLTTDPSVYSAT